MRKTISQEVMHSHYNGAVRGGDIKKKENKQKEKNLKPLQIGSSRSKGGVPSEREREREEWILTALIKICQRHKEEQMLRNSTTQRRYRDISRVTSIK